MRTVALLILASAGAVAAPIVSDSSTADSVMRPLPFHGAVSALCRLEVYRTFTRDSIAGLPYRTLEDVLDWRTASYTLSTGAIGDWNVPLLFGERPRDHTMRADGAPMTSAAVGIFPPSMVNPEFMERMDILVGSDAAILAGASTGTAYWIQQPWYDTRSPYTRVWYCQSAYDFLATDGVLSQNVARNLNATLGFRRMVTPGRYANQWLDVWNTRALLRWNLSSTLNLSLVHRFANWGLGTNGGVDPTKSDDPTNERTAQVFYSKLDERLFRHDLALVGTYRFSPSRVGSAGIALQFEQWNLYRTPTLAIGVDSSTHVRWQNTGVRGFVRWEERLDSQLAAIIGTEANVGAAGSSDYTAAIGGSDCIQGAGFGYVRWDMSPFVFRGGVRLHLARGMLWPIVGAAVRFGDSTYALTFDGSRTIRIPSLVEGMLPPERAWLLMVRLETVFGSAVRVSATGYWRRYENPVIAEPIARGDTIVATTGAMASPMHRSGLTIESFCRIGHVQLRPQFVFSFTGARELPFLYAAMSLGYEYRIGRNRIGGELFLRARTHVRAERFIPQSWGYLPTEIPLPAATDGGTVMLWAQLGNATVKLALGNVLSAYYATLSTFPQLDRHITLSVGWSFFD